MRALTSILLILSLVACDGDGGTEPEPETATLTGRWTGTATGVAADVTVNEAAGGAVTGSGTLTLPQASLPITVSGTNRYPDVDLTIRSPGQPDGRFVGTFSDEDTVFGTLSASGFPPFSITLRRQ